MTSRTVLTRPSEVTSRVQLFVTMWTAAYHTPPCTGFYRQECWSGLPFPSPKDLPNPGIKLRSPTLQADALLSEPPVSIYFCLFAFLCQLKSADHFISPLLLWDRTTLIVFLHVWPFFLGICF